MRLLSIAVVLVAAAPARAQPDTMSCCGTERASLGSFFSGLKLGQTSTATLPPAEALGEYIELELELTGKRVDGVVMTISDTTRKPPLCPVLRSRLTTKWGAPTRDRWLAADRAVAYTTLEPPSCTLHFYRLVPPAQWLNTSQQSVVPIWAIGRPKAELEAVLAPLEPEPEQEGLVTGEHFVRWRDTSIDGQRITLTGYVSRGRVTAIVVEVYDHGLQAWQRLIAMYGAPDTSYGHEDLRRWTWRRAHIELDNDASDMVYPPGTREDPHPRQPDGGTHTSILFGTRPK